MNLFRQLILSWFARRDARVGVEAGGELVTVARGPRPRFDPAGNQRHARLAREAALISELEEAEDDERRASDKLAEYPNPHLLTITFCLLIVGEFLGGLFVARSLGFEGPERVIVAGLLALSIIALVTFCVKQGSEATRTGEGATSRRLLFFGLLATLGLLVGAISITRLQEIATNDEGSRLGNLAAAVIAVACTTGPAAIAELVLRARRTSMPLLRQLQRARRTVRDLRRRQARAAKEIDRIAVQVERFDREEAQDIAAYGREHRVARALLDANPPSSDGTTHD